MKSQIILMALFFLINLVSALDIYSGENVTIHLDFEIVNCSVIDSVNNLEGLNLSWSENNIIISTVPNYQSDNLTISCFVIIGNEIIEQHYYSGGSSCRYNKTFNWNCSEWNNCINGSQTRLCKKYNNCHNKYGKPNETQSCIINNTINQTENQTDVIKIETKSKIKWYINFLKWIKNVLSYFLR